MNDCTKEFFSADRILVLAPHPDDETLGCGGTIAGLSKMGKEVSVLVITRGDAVNVKIKDIVKVRQEEAKSACDILGVRKLDFLDFPDGSLSEHYEEARQVIMQNIRQYSPDVVFCTSPMDLHNDHIVLSKMVLSLLHELKSFNVAFYEIYTPIRHNCLVDITDVMERKEIAVRRYTYSLLEKPESMLHAVKGLNAFRSFDSLENGYFESFYVISAADAEDHIIDWLTYGLSREASSYKFLSQFKKVDQLLAAYQNSLKKIDELDDALKEKGKKIEEIEREYKALQDKRMLKMVYSLYRVRDVFLPHNTKRRSAYDAIVKKIKLTRKTTSKET